MQEKTFILNKTDIDHKIKRLAYEIVENNMDEKEIIIAGIYPNGTLIAKQLRDIITNDYNIDIKLITVSLDKKLPSTITLHETIDLNNKTIIVVDDVSMTGKTMLYALQPFLQQQPKKIQTLVLVERQLKNFPIHSDFVGLHISTTLQDLIIVEEKNGELTNAYLM
jgi:pyrimidine operon attenuation protein / uracil phosphoribosyltransferase